jgi:hypothetical protein
MAQVQIANVVVPAEFMAYQVENSMVSTALFQSGVAVPNGEIQAQLEAGAESFAVPFWSDLPDVEADITSDDPTVNSTAQKVTAAKQIVRKSFVHASWSEMSLASELSGSDALVRVQSRVQAYWDRQWEKRLIASLMGVLYSNVADNASDMVNEAANQRRKDQCAAPYSTQRNLGPHRLNIYGAVVRSASSQCLPLISDEQAEEPRTRCQRLFRFYHSTDLRRIIDVALWWLLATVALSARTFYAQQWCAGVSSGSS